MKPLLVIVLILLFGAVSQPYAQTDIVEVEVEKIATELANTLNRKRISGKFAVVPFVDGAGQETRLTNLVTNLVENQLTNESISFRVAQSIDSGNNNSNGTRNIFQKGVDIFEEKIKIITQWFGSKLGCDFA